jgi:hypothetical protein
MRLVNLSKIVLLVLSTSCIANAYLTPGQIDRDSQYQHDHSGYGQGGYDDCSDADGCWVDPGSGGGSVDQPGRPGRPGRPGQPGYPGQPPLTPWPGQPHEPPPYPGNPGYPPPPPPPGYGRQQVNINVYQQLYGNDRLDLTTYFPLSRYRGWSIEQVVIEGRVNGYSSAAINLVLNGNNYGQAWFSSNYTQSQSIWLSRRPMIGNGADSIMLYSSGQMVVERVTLILSR